MALFEDLSNIPDPVLVEDGIYEVRIQQCEQKQSQSGGSYLNIRMSIEGHEDAEPLFHVLFFPREDDTQSQRNNTLRNAASFARAFGLNLGGFDAEDTLGKTANASIKRRKKNNSEQFENVVATWA